jgi:hypothetical protein
MATVLRKQHLPCAFASCVRVARRSIVCGVCRTTHDAFHPLRTCGAIPLVQGRHRLSLALSFCLSLCVPALCVVMHGNMMLSGATGALQFGYSCVLDAGTCCLQKDPFFVRYPLTLLLTQSDVGTRPLQAWTGPCPASVRSHGASGAAENCVFVTNHECPPWVGRA